MILPIFHDIKYIYVHLDSTKIIKYFFFFIYYFTLLILPHDFWMYESNNLTMHVCELKI